MENLKFDTSKDDKDLITLKVTVSKEDFDKELEKQIEYYKPRVNIKGFRVGHAPNNVILSRHKEALIAATNEALIEEVWNSYNEKENAMALGLPKLSSLDNTDNGLTLVYEYYPAPEISLPDLSTITVEKDKYEVDDSVVEEAYKLSLTRFSQYVESELKSEKGDRVSVKLDFEDDNYKKYNKEFIVTANADDEDIFAKNAIEVKKGDKKLLNTFIDNFEVTLMMEVIKVEKADVKDDSKEEERAKVKESLKTHLEKRAIDKADSELINKTLFDKFLDLVKVDIPKGYYEEELSKALANFEKSFENSNSTKVDYLMAISKKEDEVKKEYEESVRKQISFDLIMAKLAETYKDSITIDEDKAKEYANRMYQYQSYMGLSKLPKEDQQKIVNSIMRDAQNRAVSEAVLNYVKSHININEKSATKFKVEESDIWGGY